MTVTDRIRRLPSATLGNHFEYRFVRRDRLSRVWKQPR